MLLLDILPGLKAGDSKSKNMLDIFRAWLVDASQRLAFACRSLHWSYSLSTSFNGPSARKMISRIFFLANVAGSYRPCSQFK